MPDYGDDRGFQGRPTRPTMRDVAGAGPTNVGRPRSYPPESIGDNQVWRDAYHREGGVKDQIRSQMPWDQPEYRRADKNFGFRQYHPDFMEEQLRAGQYGPGRPQSYPGMQNPGVKSRMEMLMAGGGGGGDPFDPRRLGLGEVHTPTEMFLTQVV